MFPVVQATESRSNGSGSRSRIDYQLVNSFYASHFIIATLLKFNCFSSFDYGRFVRTKLGNVVRLSLGYFFGYLWDLCRASPE